MHRLPDLHVPRTSPEREVREYIACLSRVQPEENFCAVKVTTEARPITDTSEVAKTGGNTQNAVLLTSWSASERAVAILSEEAAHSGWYFFVPMSRTPFAHAKAPNLRLEANEQTVNAVDELWQIVDSDSDPSWDHHMHDIGARGRKEVRQAQAHQPEIYALGVRM